MTFCRERLMVATFSSGSVCEAWIVISGVAFERVEDLAPYRVVVLRLVRANIQIQRRAGLGESGAGLRVGHRLVLVLAVEDRTVIAIASQTNLDSVVVCDRAAHATAAAQVVVQHAIQ
jgi:hypothetical protein